MQFFSGRSAYDKLVQSTYKSSEERDLLIAEVRAQALRPTLAVALFLHPDAGVRAFAADFLTARSDVPAFIELLDRGHEVPAARSHVARLWARLSPEAGQKLLEALLSDKLSNRRRQGWEVLLLLSGEWRIRYLERGMVDAPAMLRLPLLQKLLAEPATEAQFALLLRLSSDEDAGVAIVALEAAAKFEDPRLLEVMVERLSRGDFATRDIAGRWLRKSALTNSVELRRRMIEMLASGEEATRHTCVEIILESGAEDLVITEVLMYSRGLVGWLRTRILETLRGFGERVFRPACVLLGHPDAEVRTAALVLTENFNDARLVDPLCGMLKDQDWWLRITACDALGRLRDERAVGPL